MPAPEITPLPPAPSRLDEPGTFTNTADAFLSALPGLQSEVNAVVEWMGDTVTEIAELAGNGAQSATLSQEWAEGTEPGGPGTDSAKGHADRAETLADNLNDRLTVIDQPGSSEGGTIALADGTIVQEYLPNGVAAPAFGTTRQPIVSEDKEYLGEITGSVADNGLRAAAYDEETGALLFGVDEDDQFFCKLDPSVIPPSPSSEEVVAARGTAADLNERLSRALTPAGSPKTAVQNISRLRVLRSAITHQRLGGTGLHLNVYDAHSWFDSKNYGSVEAAQLFYEECGLPNAGPGWIGVGSAQGGGAGIHGTALNNISVTRTGTWTDLFPSASGSPGSPQNYPGYDAARSAADGSTYTFTGAAMGGCSTLLAFCKESSVIEQSWDGGTSYTALSIASGSGSTTASVSPSPTASFTGTIVGTTLTVSGVTGTITPEMTLTGTGVISGTKIVSGSGTTWTVNTNHASSIGPVAMTGKSNSLRLRLANGSELAGIFGLSASSGVVFANLSNSGSTAVQKATVQAEADYQAMLREIGSLVTSVTVIVNLSLNDTKAGTPVETIVEAVGEIVAGYRSAFTGFPSCDVLVACDPNTPLSVQDALAPLLRAYAEDNDCAFLDWQEHFGIPDSSGDYASYARDYTSGSPSTALPLLQVSTGFRHPSTPADLIAAGEDPSLCGSNLVAGVLSGALVSAFKGY